MISEKRIIEMSKGRSAIRDVCGSLGKLFIEHFHKIYEEGVYGDDFLTIVLRCRRGLTSAQGSPSSRLLDSLSLQR